MTYSCARFAHDDATLEEAQAAKHELVCRKLGLDRHPGARLLDVGCGWGSMAIHAALRHGARVIGITLSREQVSEARRRVDGGRRGRPGGDPSPGLPRPRRRAVRRHLLDRHVRARRLLAGVPVLRDARPGLIRPTGRLLNHAISTPGGSVFGRQFLHRSLRVPRRRAHRRRRRRRGHGARRVRGPRRRIAARALQPDAPPLGGQPRGALGRGRRPGRCAPGPASGGCTWPPRPTASTTAASPSTRCSAWSPTPPGRAGMPATRAGWERWTPVPGGTNQVRRRGSADGELLAVDAGRPEAGHGRGQLAEDARPPRRRVRRRRWGRRRQPPSRSSGTSGMRASSGTPRPSASWAPPPLPKSS